MSQVQVGYQGPLVKAYGAADALAGPGISGDIEVLRRLFLRETAAVSDAGWVAPADRNVLMLGDSRLANVGVTAMVASYEWPIGGMTLPWNNLGNVAWAGSAINAASVTPVATPFGTLASMGSSGMLLATMNGTTVPGGNDAVNRVFYGAAFQPSIYVNGWQFANRTMRVYATFLEHPEGMVGNHVYLSARVASAVSTYRSAFFSTYGTTQRFKTVYFDVPARSWAENVMDIECCVEQGYTPQNGEMLVCVGTPIVRAENGIVFNNQSVGGRWTSSYDNLDIWDTAAFLRGAGSFSTNWTLWIDLGTNGTGPGFNTTEQDFNFKKSIIEKFRAVIPRGDVILTNAHDAGQSSPGNSTWFRDANMRLATYLERVVAIDSQNLFLPYAKANALGYFADAVHLGATGCAAWADTVFTAMRRASSTQYRIGG